MDCYAHRLRANTFVQPEHHREKKRQHQTPGQRCLKKPCENRRQRTARYGDEQPRETKPKNAPRRRASDLFDAKSQCLKKFGTDRRSRTMSIFALTGL